MTTVYLVVSWDASWQCSLREQKEVLSSIEEQYFASRVLYTFIASLVPSLPK